MLSSYLYNPAVTLAKYCNQQSLLQTVLETLNHCILYHQNTVFHLHPRNQTPHLRCHCHAFCTQDSKKRDDCSDQAWP
uniref:Uncharacterized protein n=1 Tax=Salix viminalis TaxID=40686 RepID=A0A6N2NCU3_SALVM